MPGYFGVLESMKEDEKLRKIIRAHREKRFASVYKKKVRELARKARKKK